MRPDMRPPAFMPRAVAQVQTLKVPHLQRTSLKKYVQLELYTFILRSDRFGRTPVIFRLPEHVLSRITGGLLPQEHTTAVSQLSKNPVFSSEEVFLPPDLRVWPVCSQLIKPNKTPPKHPTYKFCNSTKNDRIKERTTATER